MSTTYSSSQVNPAPPDPETWIAVLMTLARQLTAAGHGVVADHVYRAIAEFSEPE